MWRFFVSSCIPDILIGFKANAGPLDKTSSLISQRQFFYSNFDIDAWVTVVAIDCSQSGLARRI